MEKILSSNTTVANQELLNQCKICGSPAKYSYFGVISCNSCKMFFKRNAERGEKISKCKFNNRCETTINNRHECSCCRLNKCFHSGMQIELIRPSHPKTRVKRKLSTDSIEQTQIVLAKLNECTQFPTLNLLNADLSTLTVDQWNLISNLSHCYDDHSGLSIGERYVREQHALPPRLRFKTTSMIVFIGTIFNEAQLLYKNNQDFLSLSLEDRSTLLHSTTAHTASLSSNFIFHQIGLMDCPTYYNSLEIITHASLIPTAKRIANRLDFDIIVIKLMLAILSFSTISYTSYSNSPPVNLSNTKLILKIQDTYIDLTWRYLVYKYNYEQAIKCFSDLIRCLFAINQAMVEIEEIQWYTNMVDSFVQTTEQILIVDN
ncbi:unnamed protein product [Adineta steineri]|uniref:Nuclear receptor domain-containing protein n=1 Tax=Adineta steineri TaxID=433720 RepID=A0A815Y504_9BILA|nr:unnamed protein product [Adineta steineri]CAF1565645.1 unnamed protein product [Adineta steineri]